METTGIIGVIWGLYRGYIGVILGLYRNNGKENGNYDLGYVRRLRYIGIMEKWKLRFRV